MVAALNTRTGRGKDRALRCGAARRGGAGRRAEPGQGRRSACATVATGYSLRTFWYVETTEPFLVYGCQDVDGAFDS